MADHSLSVSELERLFALSDDDYQSQAPDWIQQVLPADVDGRVDDLLEQLKSNTSTASRLEQFLQAQGVALPQDIPYLEAKQKVIDLNQKLLTISDIGSQEYKQLCIDLEKYTTALLSSDEYHVELRRQEQAWEDQHRDDNLLALQAVRRHMPIQVRSLSETALVQEHGVPKALAKKIQRTDILQLLRKDPEDIAKTHPGLLENLKTAGLTLTERRALHAHLAPIASKYWIKAKDEMTQRKQTWFQTLKAKLKSMIDEYQKHVQEHGSPSSATKHKCNKIGNQCPFKADNATDYSGDLGCPSGNVYEVSNVTKAPKPYVREEEESSSKSSSTNISKPAFLAGIGAAANKPSNESKAPSFLGDIAKSAASSKKRTEKPPAAPPAAKTIATDSAKSKPSSLLGEITKPKGKAAEVAACPAPVRRTPSFKRRSSARELEEAAKLATMAVEPPKKSAEEKRVEAITKASEAAKRKRAEKRKKLQKVLEDHHKRAKELEDAKATCQALETAMDTLDSSMCTWIDIVVLHKNNPQSKVDSQQELANFQQAVSYITPKIDTQMERLKWVGPSLAECELVEDLYRVTAIVFNFILVRLHEIKNPNRAIRQDIKDLQETSKTLYVKNARKLQQHGVSNQQTERTREIVSWKTILEQKELQATVEAQKADAMKKAEAAAAEAEAKNKAAADTRARAKATADAKAAAEAEAQARAAKKAAVEKEKPPPAPKKELEIEKPKATPTGDHMRLQRESYKRRPSRMRTMEYPTRTHLKWQLVHQLEQSKKLKRRLENAISNAGLTVPDEKISYSVAEAKIAEISKKMSEISFKHPDYYKLEQLMSKYQSALLASPEYHRKLRDEERAWEESMRSANEEALRMVRRHMPVDIRKMSEADLISQGLSTVMAKKFKRTNVLLLLRSSLENVEKMHYANFDGMSLSGLTLTERRALYAHLKPVGQAWEKQKKNEQIERKYTWFQSMKFKLRDDLKKYEEHVAKFGSGGSHSCNLRGNQCPIKADAVIDYSSDLGFPSDAVYEHIEIAKEDLSYYQQRARELREQG